MKSLDAFLYGPKDLRLETVEIPELGPTQIVVKLRACGICGSDVECYLGHSKEGRYDLGPYTPGHEWCGNVYADARNIGPKPSCFPTPVYRPQLPPVGIRAAGCTGIEVSLRKSCSYVVKLSDEGTNYFS